MTTLSPSFLFGTSFLQLTSVFVTCSKVGQIRLWSVELAVIVRLHNFYILILAELL